MYCIILCYLAHTHILYLTAFPSVPNTVDRDPPLLDVLRVATPSNMTMAAGLHPWTSLYRTHLARP